MRTRLGNLPRRTKQGLVASLDFVLLSLSFWISLLLGLGQWILPAGDQLLFMLIAPLAALPIFASIGLYRTVFRYVSVHMGWAIFKAVSVFSAVFGSILLLYGTTGIPRSAILINALLSFLLISGTRVLSRWWFFNPNAKLSGGEPFHRTLIYGAGEAGVQLAAALAQKHEVRLLGFLDDNPALVGKVVRGLKVHPAKDFLSSVKKHDADQVLLAIPSAPRSRRKEIVNQLTEAKIQVLTLPSLGDIASGKVQVSDLRPVKIADILGRDPVAPDENLLDQNVAGKKVMVTGAGGSVGSDLCRQLLHRHPEKLIIFERSEFALYCLERELSAWIRENASACQLVTVLGSVNQQDLLEKLMVQHGVHTVYHAAAYKHVPLVEANASQGVYNNIFGTWRTARAAMNAKVERFVLISTHEAVRPTNVMGATKRFAEMIVQCMDHKSDTVMCMVRFGNVLGSSGSVVPLFQSQIEAGGPVTVTHPDVTRFFMTIPEASQLVIQAGAMATGGDVFVLDMGEPIRIDDLARRMIHLSGFTVRDANNTHGDIEIAYSGLRPGEKLYEELLIRNNTSETAHPLILRAQEYHQSENALISLLDRLNGAMLEGNNAEMIALLQKSVVEYKPKASGDGLTSSPPHGIQSPSQMLPVV
jgi:FlaA1/EpsC-like NDP-sugar epimerase